MRPYALLLSRESFAVCKLVCQGMTSVVPYPSLIAHGL